MKQLIRAIFSSCIFQIKVTFSRPIFKYFMFVDPIIFAFVTYMMYKDTSPQNFTAYVVFGTGLLTLWNSVVFTSAGQIEQERYMGTLEFIASAPVSFKTVMLGKIVGNAILSVISILVTFMFIGVLFNAPIHIENRLLFILILLISLISFIGLSMLVAGFFTLSRNSRALMNSISYPIVIICGFLFPIEVLPIWTRPISYILSPTWVVKLLRMCAAGISDYQMFYRQSAILLTVTLIYFIVGYFMFERIEKLARINATLEVQ